MLVAAVPGSGRSEEAAAAAAVPPACRDGPAGILGDSEGGRSPGATTRVHGHVLRRYAARPCMGDERPAAPSPPTGRVAARGSPARRLRRRPPATDPSLAQCPGPAAEPPPPPPPGIIKARRAGAVHAGPSVTSGLSGPLPQASRDGPPSPRLCWGLRPGPERGAAPKGRRGRDIGGSGSALFT